MKKLILRLVAVLIFVSAISSCAVEYRDRDWHHDHDRDHHDHDHEYRGY
ncbi:MAG TPA: hypothetical protein VFE53_16405 [Mucilaginibacter sp.]|jgi:hypothetical protein|nr:hypothetical protein [Mucilaginibacter sp.]